MAIGSLCKHTCQKHMDIVNGMGYLISSHEFFISRSCFPGDLEVGQNPVEPVHDLLPSCVSSRVLGRPGPGPDRLGLKCYLAWGGTRVVGRGGKG